MKVICAGAPKTGTKSIAKALRMLGYNSVYDAEEAVEFAFEQWEDLFHERQPNIDKVLDHYAHCKVEAVVDLPHSNFFDKFLERWPDAKVILMIRGEEAWFQSYKQMVEDSKKYKAFAALHVFSPTLKRFQDYASTLFTMTVGSFIPHKFLWTSWYRRHNVYVRTTVPADQLLEFSVKEGWEPLCTFLNKPVPDASFPFENSATGSNKIQDKMMMETRIIKKARKELQQFFLGIFAVAVVLVGIYFCW